MGLFGISFPWETAAGEGFIAPWTPSVETPQGRVQVAAAQPGDQLQSGFEDLSGMAPGGGLDPYAFLPGGGEVIAPATPFTPPTVDKPPATVAPQPGDDLDAGGLFGTGLFAPVDRSSQATVQELGIPAAVTPGGALWPALAAGGTAALSLLLARLKLPSETPAGEGFIAPWTQQEQLPSGLWGQEGMQYGNGRPAIPPGLASMTYAQIKGGAPVKAWSNASRDGRIPASVLFVMFSNGMMASQSLVDGQIKTWRPKKHVVISSNPRMSQIRKLDNLHKRTVKRLVKMKGIKAG